MRPAGAGRVRADPDLVFSKAVRRREHANDFPRRSVQDCRRTNGAVIRKGGAKASPHDRLVDARFEAASFDNFKFITNQRRNRSDSAHGQGTRLCARGRFERGDEDLFRRRKRPHGGAGKIVEVADLTRKVRGQHAANFVEGVSVENNGAIIHDWVARSFYESHEERQCRDGRQAGQAG